MAVPLQDLFAILVTDNSKGSCFGAGASRNFKIYRNRARNVTIGVNFDTYPAENLDIFENDLRGVLGRGVLFNNGSLLKRIRIHDNIIDMAPTAGPAIFPGEVRATAEIYRNTIIQRSSGAGIGRWRKFARHISR
jgi:hypothetical protein